MKVLDFITFKELNEIKKMDRNNKLYVNIQKDGSLEEFDVFTWKDCLGQKSYVVKGYKYGLGSFHSKDYDTLEEALDFVAEAITTNFSLIERCLGDVSYINDSRKQSLAFEIRY